MLQVVFNVHTVGIGTLSKDTVMQLEFGEFLFEKVEATPIPDGHSIQARHRIENYSSVILIPNVKSMSPQTFPFMGMFD